MIKHRLESKEAPKDGPNLKINIRIGQFRLTFKDFILNFNSLGIQTCLQFMIHYNYVISGVLVLWYIYERYTYKHYYYSLKMLFNDLKIVTLRLSLDFKHWDIHYFICLISDIFCACASWPVRVFWNETVKWNCIILLSESIKQP